MIWKVVYPLRHGMVVQPLEGGGGSDIFTAIYNRNYWGSDESKSGAGSTMAYTRPLREALPGLLRRHRIRSVFDAPCGDFNWMRSVDLGESSYIGGDIVPQIVEEAQRLHGNDARRFVLHDIIRQAPQAADLWICRDVLFHLTFADALEVLKQFASSNVRFLLSTSYYHVDSVVDLDRTGGFRHIDLRKPPFNLPEPIQKVDDFVFPWAPRYMGLWTREQIAAALRVG